MSKPKKIGRAATKSGLKFGDGRTVAGAALGREIGKAEVFVGQEIGASRRGDTGQLNAQQAAVKRGEAVMRGLGSRVSAAELEAVIGIVERAFEPVESSATPSEVPSGGVTGQESLMELLTGGRTYAAAERAALELSHLGAQFRATAASVGRRPERGSGVESGGLQNAANRA